jgi:hypothetical protein
VEFVPEPLQLEPASHDLARGHRAIVYDAVVGRRARRRPGNANANANATVDDSGRQWRARVDAG